MYTVDDRDRAVELERRNHVHPAHKPAHYAELHHYIFAFHDSVVECIAKAFEVTRLDGPLLGLVPELRRRLGEHAGA